MTNKETVRTFIEKVLNQYQFDELDKFVSLKFQTHSLHLNPIPPIAGSNPLSFKEALIQSQKVLENFNRKIEEIFESGNKVVVRHTTSAIHIGEFMGIPASNKKISFAGISIYEVSEGKITDEWYVWDRLGLYQQLGML